MSFTFLQRVANRANSIWGRGGGRAKGALVQKIYCKFREQINYVVIEIWTQVFKTIKIELLSLIYKHCIKFKCGQILFIVFSKRGLEYI